MTIDSLKIGILGAGRIASGFGGPDQQLPLCLAHAVQLTPEMHLGGFYDVSEEAALAAEKKWATPASPRDLSQWLEQDWDVICIASPDACHAEHLELLLNRKPRLKGILAEKPLCIEMQDAERLLAKAEQLKIPLLINYPRRHHPELKQLITRIQQGKFGSLRRTQITCSGGLLHNGSHAIDLMAACLPHDVLPQLEVEGVFPRFNLYTKGDASFSTEVIMLDSVQQDTQLWEITCDFEHARITLRDSPETLSCFLRQPHPEYEGFHTLQLQAQHKVHNQPLLLFTFQRLVEIIKIPQEANLQIELEKNHQRTLRLFFSQPSH